LGEVDGALGALLEGLRARNLEQVVNLMVVSDHGMSYVTPEKSVYYDDYIDTSDLLLEESLQPHLGIRTRDPKQLASIYKTLKHAQIKERLPFQVYWREDIPARFHYSNNPRISPLVVIADPGYVMTRRDMGLSVVGVHGWDNQMHDMRAVFAAQGPNHYKRLKMWNYTILWLGRSACRSRMDRPTVSVMAGFLDPVKSSTIEVGRTKQLKLLVYPSLYATYTACIPNFISKY